MAHKCVGTPRIEPQNALDACRPSLIASPLRWLHTGSARPESKPVRNASSGPAGTTLIKEIR